MNSPLVRVERADLVGVITSIPLGSPATILGEWANLDAYVVDVTESTVTVALVGGDGVVRFPAEDVVFAD